MSDLGDTIIDHNYLQQMRIRQSIPVAWCLDTKNVLDTQSFVPAILVKISTTTWELMDENDDEMKQLVWDGDEGVKNLFGIYIKQPDGAFCEHYQTLVTTSSAGGSQNKESTFFVSPTRDGLRKRAGDNMVMFAESMKKSALKRTGDNKICEVGEVVHVALKNEDKAKVDSGNLTGVIEKVDKTRSQARVAVKSGLLKSWYVYHRLGRVTGVGNNVELNGLTDALNGWESMKIISEREVARQESIVGGQGKGDVTCSCKGKCNSNHCSCKKAGRICASACHRNNFNCVNHDRVDMFLPK